MKKKITTSLIFITFAFSSFAQVYLDKSMKSKIESIENFKTITLLKSSENQEVLFDINGSNKSMDIVIHYVLNSGEFKLEIYDPQGAIYEQAVTIDSKYEFAEFPLPINKIRFDEDAISEIEKKQNIKRRKYTGPLPTNKIRLDEDAISEIEKEQSVKRRYKYTGPLPTNKIRLDEDSISEIEKEKNAEGRLVWFVDKPEEGKWTVLLIPNEADGKVKITFNE
tara:strand:+ start:5482 stop:6150 length:669 start_codon:yes stop_codon:yes gene_type:complete